MTNKPTINDQDAGLLNKTNQSSPNKWIAVVLVVFSLGVVSGCATTSSPPSTKDPFEKVNRVILELNLRSDRVILKPITRAYTRVVPSPIRTGVHNFFSNLWQPMTVVNDVLQGKLGYAARDTSRFLINTTFGIFGIFDPASKLELPEHREDFGQTLAVWGIPSGPYLVLPFLGSSNLRDSSGLVAQFAYADAVSYMDSPEIYYAGLLRLVDARAQLLGADDILDLQSDKYLFIRENYRQQRLNAIHDGATPSESDDDLLEQLLENE